MKKSRILAALLCLTFLLGACGKDGSSAEESQPSYSGGLNEATMEWTGQGGAYKMENIELPELCQDVDIYGGELYYLVQSEPDINPYHILRGDRELGTVERDYNMEFCVKEDGIYMLDMNFEEEGRGISLSKYSPELEPVFTAELNGMYESERYGYGDVQSVKFSGEKIYLLVNQTQLLILDGGGQLTGSGVLPGEGLSLVLSEDGTLYAAGEEAEELTLYRLDGETGEFTQAFTCPAGSLFDGGDGSYLRLLTDQGIYSLDAQGTASPKVIWSECYLNPGSIYKVKAEGGEFLCLGSDSCYLLTPAEPAELQPKTELLIACMDPNGMDMLAARFNAHSDEYYVRVVDYSGGIYASAEEVQLRLNTELISGRTPDMFCFFSGWISPNIYAGKGLLVDMKPLIEADKNLSPEDIVLYKALDYNGGIYVMGESFYLDTMAARESDFGQRYGWTLEEYRQIDAGLREDQMCIYNLTRELFIYNVIGRYVRYALDWTSGDCSFDSPEFIDLLRTALELRETPEDINDMVFGPGEPRVAAGEQTTVAVFAMYVSSLAESEQRAGCPLSFIGWPTPDGSCGTDASLNTQLAICSLSRHQEGCWKFIKYMLMNADTERGNMPGYPLLMYRPALEESIAKAMADEEAQVKMTRADAHKLLDFLDAIENLSDYDRAIMDIINSECQAMFAGDKTPEETAELIQSRASLYVAEQS